MMLMAWFSAPRVAEAKNIAKAVASSAIFLLLRPEKNGVPLAAEIIPFEPDSGNADVGIKL